MDVKGFVTCSMCDFKFMAKNHIYDYDASIVKCPYCDELLKVTNMKPIKPKEPTIYYLVTYAHFVDGDSLKHASWVTRDEAFGGTHVWRNMVGGMCPSEDGDRVHEVTMADDIFDLDWTKTYMYAGLKEDFYSGWLSPDGDFIQSADNMYENTADYIIGKSSDELKREGWLQLRKMDKKPYYTPRKLVTKKQFDWLKSKGYETVDMEDIE